MIADAADQWRSQARTAATLTAVTVHMTQREFIRNDFLKSERSGVGLWSQCSLIQFFCLSELWTVKDQAGYLHESFT